MQSHSLPMGKNDMFMSLRPYLYTVAYHILANVADAEDMVQECFLRWEKTDESQVRVPKAFLTTTVTRLCLKHLQSARIQREEYFGSSLPDVLDSSQADPPDAVARLADSLSEALLVVLKALSPLERAVFLLREVFDCDYGEIAAIVKKSEENCRQILRRAREQVASRRSRYEVMPQHEERIVKSFLQAAAAGNWTELTDMLSDEATLVCDGANLGQAAVSVQGVRSVSELVVQQATRWLGDGRSVQTVCFQTLPGILICRNGLPVSAIFAATQKGEVQYVRVITCPVRLRSLLVLSSN